MGALRWKVQGIRPPTGGEPSTVGPWRHLEKAAAGLFEGEEAVLEVMG